MKILAIDFDEHELSSIYYFLGQDSYNVQSLDYSKEVFEKISDNIYSLILLNISSEKKDSVKRCQSIRKESMIPIIVISDDEDLMKKILAFDYGADDFLVKPYNDLELKARIKALIRRQNYYKDFADNRTEIIRGPIKVNTITRKITVNDELINFTGKEFDLLSTLLANPKIVFTRVELLEKVWGYSYYGDLRTVDVHIRRIRGKFEKLLPNSQVVSTKWGQGYYFDELSL
ncbi:MAG: response regulator transcription factor [Tissierellia bacterium]|nr:response regulator transcription factor [Tissierellia bacterium]